MGIRAAWGALWSGEAKASAAGAAISVFNVGQPVFTPRRYDSLATEGYEKCAVAFRCIREVASGVASVPLLLKSGKNELEKHPILDLLKRPNPRQGGASLIETLIVYHLISGNSYLEAVRPGSATAMGKPGKRPPTELWALRPDRMKVVEGRMGVPQGYEYEANGVKVQYDADPVTGRSDTIMHLADPHPTNDWYGLSPIEVAATGVDQWNQYGAYNVALMQNQCRPPGALVFRPLLDRISGATTSPPEEVIKKAERKLRENHAGVANAGKPLVLSGDVDWINIGLSPAEMGFMEGKLSTARDICTAFGVPFVLIVTGDSTYNNRSDARLELWEQTILPLTDRFLDRLNAWLIPQYGADGELRIEWDLDEIPALEPRRYAKWDRAMTGYEKGILTREEARIAMGYAAKPENGESFVQPANSTIIPSEDADKPVQDATGPDNGGRGQGSGKADDGIEEKIGRVLSYRNERLLLESRDASRAATKKVEEVVRQVQQQPVKGLASPNLGEAEDIESETQA